MKKIIQKFFLFFVPLLLIGIKTFGQCTPNNIAFVGGEIIYNTACGDNSYQVIKGDNLPGASYKWEVSYSGSAFQTIVNFGNVPISSSDLSKNDITNFILNKNANSSGDYRIRRIATNASKACTNTSDPVFLYYAENQSSLSGGTISNLAPINCSPAIGALLLTGQTGPVLRWESSIDGINWTIINNVTNTLNYNNISSPLCYRALVDNICNGSPGIIDPLDKYSSTFCISLTAPPIVIGPVSTTVCQGSDLTLSVSASSTISLTYQWRKGGIPIPGANSASLIIPHADLSDAGSYDVEVSNTCGSTLSSTATINVVEVPTLNTPSAIKICSGTIYPETIFTSDQSGVSYSWTNSNTGIGLPSSGLGKLPSFTAINPTNAPITATIRVIPTINSCAGSEYSFTITIDPLPTVVKPSDEIVCAGEIVPSSNFITNTIGTILTWTNSNPAIGLPGSGTGNIPSFFATNTTSTAISAIITVTPIVNGCTGPAVSYNIQVNPVPTIISAVPIDETACNINDGMIRITASGSSPLEYSIDGGNTFVLNGGEFTGLAAGTYTVAVKNASNCITIGPLVSISSPGAPPKPEIDSYISPVCEGQALTLEIKNPDPLATYNWTGPNGFTATGIVISRSNADLSMSGDYAVTAIINSCVSDAKIINVKVNPLPIMSSIQNLAFCNGNTVTEIIFNSNQPGTTFSWTNSNPSIGLASSGNTKIPGFTALNNSNLPVTATITVRPKLGDCLGNPSTFTITINPTPIVSAPADFSVCAGNNVALTTLISNVSGTNFTWTNSNPTIGLPANGIGNIPAFIAENNTKIAKTAVIIITPMVNGCTGPTSTYTITVNPIPRVSNSILSQSICTGSSNSTVTFTSDIPGTSFSWTASASSTIQGHLTSGTNTIPSHIITNNGLLDGIITYTIIPLLNGCAGAPVIYTIRVSPLPTATISGSKTVCFGAKTTLKVDLTGSAPWTIDYTDGTTTQTIGGITSNSFNFNVIAEGTKTYTITSVKDANNCSNIGIGNAVITQASSAINATASYKNVSCYGLNNGSITIETVSGGFGTYEYSIDGGGNWQSSMNFTGLSVGHYSVYVRDAALTQCITIIYPDIEISQPTSALGLSFIRTDISCFGGNNGSLKIIPNGGSMPYTFQWLSGENSDEITNLKAGNYTVKISDSKGCNYTETISIREPSQALKISTSKTDASCFNTADGSIKVITSGGTLPYKYLWSNGETTNAINNLEGGKNYSVTVVDANGCTVSENININKPDVLKASLTVKNTTCKISSDGMITTSIEGGTAPYTLNWIGLSQTGTILNNLAAGKYELEIKDSKGCSISLTANVLAGNCAPVAIDDRYNTDQEVSVSGTIASNDFDRQGERLDFKVTGNPKNGTIILKSNGDFTYQPNTDFWGTEIIDYETCNTSGLCAKASLKIEVVPFTIVSLSPSISTVPEGKKVSVSAKLLRPFKDDVIIKLGYSGVAIKNKDYVLFDQFIEIKIPAGQLISTEKITFAALSDDELEGQENIEIQISASSDPLVRIGTGATVLIEDNYPTSGSFPINENNKFPINPDIKPDPLVSPNDDGLGNDFFKIENIISFPENLVLIFNRWGNEVFRLQGYNESDRVFKGYANTGLLTNTNTPLSEGVYYYLITTKRTVLGQKIETLNKGYFILKR